MTDQLTGLAVNRQVMGCVHLPVVDPGFPRRELQPQGAPTYYLTNFSQKMHENEEILGGEGGAGDDNVCDSKNGRHQGERNLLELFNKKRNLVKKTVLL